MFFMVNLLLFGSTLFINTTRVQLLVLLLIYRHLKKHGWVCDCYSVMVQEDINYERSQIQHKFALWPKEHRLSHII